MSERRSELKAVRTAEAAVEQNGRNANQLAAVWVDNWNQINGQLIALTQNSLRHSIGAAEQLRQCQSPNEFVETQLRLARQAYDEYLDDARRLSELVVKLSSEALSSAATAAQPRA
ncbi:MAG: phasin family protein [Magnetospirillum sp.]|nr:phasin family protein [Magnetospirillum sp.]